jgi:hypothetical protein
MNFSETQDLAYEQGLEWAETTEGMNGYPTNTRPCLTDFASISEFENIEANLKARGYEVTPIIIRRKDGWALWNWSNGFIRKGMYRYVGENDWSIEVSSNDKAEEVAFHLIAEDREFDSFKEFEQTYDHMKDFIRDLSYYDIDEEGGATVFYDPDNNCAIERVTFDETTGYSEDAWTEQIAMFVDFKESDDA